MRPNVLITGVSSGIGLALAKEYLGQGGIVYGMSRRKPDELLDFSHFHFQPADFNFPDEIKSAIGRFSFEGSNLDGVILNAGVYGEINDVGEIELSAFQSVMNVNAWGNKVLLDTLFGLGMNIRQVIAMSSHAGTSAYRGSGPYCVSKAALNMLIALYATEKPKTHFCAIAPPLVHTAMQDYLTTVPSDERFASLELLKWSKEKGDMISPEKAAEILIEDFKAALKEPTGSFIMNIPAKTNVNVSENVKEAPPQITAQILSL